MPGNIVISLDFELGWGHRRVRPSFVNQLRGRQSELDERVRSLIDLFDEHEISATWTVVGKLLEDGDDPVFHNSGLYEYLLDADADHEIGLHSYEHRPYDEMDADQASDDLASGLEAMGEYGVNPQSFVFPQNRIDHIGVLDENGFRCFRSAVEASTLPSPLSKLVPPLATPAKEANNIVALPGSSFVAAPSHPLSLLRWQAALGLWRAVHGDGLVHYWFHPHNVVLRPRTLKLLDSVFTSIDAHREAGRLSVRTMAEVADTVGTVSD